MNTRYVRKAAPSTRDATAAMKPLPRCLPVPDEVCVALVAEAEFDVLELELELAAEPVDMTAVTTATIPDVVSVTVAVVELSTKTFTSVQSATPALTPHAMDATALIPVLEADSTTANCESFSTIVTIIKEIEGVCSAIR